jgi:hypothetical protein
MALVHFPFVRSSTPDQIVRSIKNDKRYCLAGPLSKSQAIGSGSLLASIEFAVRGSVVLMQQL